MCPACLHLCRRRILRHNRIALTVRFNMRARTHRHRCCSRAFACHIRFRRLYIISAQSACVMLYDMLLLPPAPLCSRTCTYNTSRQSKFNAVDGGVVLARFCARAPRVSACAFVVLACSLSVEYPLAPPPMQGIRERAGALAACKERFS